MPLTAESERQFLLNSRLHNIVMQLTAECREQFLLSPMLHQTAQTPPAGL